MKPIRKVLIVLLLISASLEVRAFTMHKTFSDVSPRDTVLINGRVISIRADVEVDTLKLSEPEKWRDNADFGMLLRVNAVVNPDEFEHVEYYVKENNTHIPELSFEMNHPFSLKKMKQFQYRLGASLGGASRLNSDLLHEDVIGFYSDGGRIDQIILISDPLQNEEDTFYTSRPLVGVFPQLKFNLGVEWHGLMRGARGWRWGVMLEYTPIKDQHITFNKLISTTPAEWDDIDPESTYTVDPTKSTYLQLKAFTSWSPWDRSWFIRGSVLWSPEKLEGAFSFGYHW